MSHQDGVGGGSNGGDSNVPTSPSLSTSSGHSEQQSTPRPQLPRSLSRGSSVSVLSSAADNVPQHHHYGTSYFANAPGSSVLGGGRPSSPPLPSGSGRRPSYRPNAQRSLSSTSVTRRQTQRTPSTVRRREESVDEEADDDLEDEEADDEVAELRARAHADDADIEEGGAVDDDDIDPITLKQRQSLINVEHPFGLPIWKPALYKKTRSVTRHADQALHSIPSAQAERHLAPGNVAWTLLFGWWLSLACGAVSLVLYVIPRGGRRYSRLVFGLAWYLFWPFGKFVEGNIRTDDEAKRDADEAETEEARPQSVATADGHGSVSPRRRGMTHTHSVSWIPPLSPGERTSLLSNGGTGLANGNGTPQQVLIAPVRSYGATSSSGYDEDTDIKSARAQDFVGKIAYWLLLTSIIAPLLLIVCLICWGLVITIPMAKLNWALLKYLFGRADSIRFCAAPPVIVLPSPPANEHQLPAESTNAQEQADATPAPPPIIQSASLTPGQVAPPSSAPTSTVLLCTYKAVGLQYYKYTIGGVNIFFVNLLAVVFFTIFDGLVLLRIAEGKERHGEEIPALLAFFTSRALIFATALVSVIPLSYFLGMAVASISAQSSIGMGAVINATFGSIIEIILYGIMLADGKGRLVEGSIIGSLLAGVLLMPGMSMVSGATRKKEMKFNAQSASVTSTMLIMAIIGTLTPTLFYQTYGNFQLVCEGCPSGGPSNSTDPWTCQHCYYRHPDPVDDPFYQDTVKSLMYFCATILLFSYLIGLWFSLRTHASHIWQKPKATHEIPVPSRLSLYQPQSAPGQAPTTGTGTGEARALRRRASNISTSTAPHSRSTTPTPRTREAVPPSILENAGGHGSQQASGHQAQTQIPGLGKRVSYAALPNIAATIQDAGLAVPGANGTNSDMHMSQAEFTRAVTIATVSALRHQAVHSPARARVSGGGGAGGHNAGVIDDGGEHGGHGAPSWSRALSASVLLGCTFLYAIIAEILVDVVDVVLEGSGLDEKFLGVTLFALVPNTTEFMNAMAFAMGGNIALSMEIGSAYALQVCLLQIPAMVAFSAWYTAGGVANAANSFNLIFPRWDVVAVIFSVFLMTYTYIEAKSNYHRGSILILSYLVLTAGFFFAPHRDDDLEEVPEVFGGAVPVSFPQTVQYLANSFFAR